MATPTFCLQSVARVFKFLPGRQPQRKLFIEQANEKAS